MTGYNNERSRKNRGYRGNKKINNSDKGKEIENINEDSLIVQQFRTYARELDDKHDRFERIIKIDRDVLVESKRVITLLQAADKKNHLEQMLHEAERKLQKIVDHHFRSIAYELENEDPYMYLKAYSNGLEEYVEALMFCRYMNNNSMESWIELQEMLTFRTPEEPIRTVQTLVTPHKFVLGIADLTGELMRKCINNLAAGDIDSCYETCNFLRSMHKGFLSCASMLNKEMNSKFRILQQSLHKVEMVCYTIKVRGSEVPKHLLVDVVNKEYMESDEEYQAY